MFVPIFHLLVFSLNVYTLYYDLVYNDLPLPEGFRDLPFKARSAFLTIWCLVFQAIYFSIALLNDFIGSNAVRPKKYGLLRRIKDIAFSLALPLAFCVFSLFWGIILTSRDLMVPKHLEGVYIPAWLNHTQHTLIIPFILTELFTSYREYPPKKIGLTIASIIFVTYISVLNLIYYKTGSWAYPIFEFLSLPGRIVFFTAALFLSLGFYFLGDKLNSLRWHGKNASGKTKKESVGNKKVSKKNV